MSENTLTEYIKMYLNGMVALSEFKTIIDMFDNDTLDSCNMNAFDANVVKGK